MKKINEIQAVVFDMDGVIFDSEREVMLAWQEVARRHNIPDIEEAATRCLGCTYDKSLGIMKEIYGEDFPYVEYKKEMSEVFHARNDGGRLPLKPYIRELLAYLKENGIKIALASSTRREVVVQELTDAGLVEYFDKLICGDMVTNSKPAPDIYLKACSELEVSPAYAVAIEDSFNGIRSAFSAGMITVMVPDLVAPDEEMRQKANMIYCNLGEFLQQLRRAL